MILETPGNDADDLSKMRTRDMGGTASTHEFTRAVLDHMEM